MTLYKFQDIGGFKFLGYKEIVKINAFQKESLVAIEMKMLYCFVK